MENTTITQTIYNLPELVKNTHLDLHLEGWPAAVSVISGCLALVAIYAIKTNNQEAVPDVEGAA